LKKSGKPSAIWGKAMTFYVLLCISLSLAGVAGLQFFYLAYLERMDKEMKKRLREVERHNVYLKQRLYDAELQIAEQAKLLESAYEHFEDEEEVWADVIEDR
jgi:16S rRNA C1402 (ribose-2'-O) methylase RsmI